MARIKTALLFSSISQARMLQFEKSQCPSSRGGPEDSKTSPTCEVPSYGTFKKAMFWDNWRFTSILNKLEYHKDFCNLSFSLNFHNFQNNPNFASCFGILWISSRKWPQRFFWNLCILGKEIDKNQSAVLIHANCISYFSISWYNHLLRWSSIVQHRQTWSNVAYRSAAGCWLSASWSTGTCWCSTPPWWRPPPRRGYSSVWSLPPSSCCQSLCLATESTTGTTTTTI